MWKELIRLSDDSANVIAQLPKGEEVGPTFAIEGVERVLSELSLSSYYFDEEAANKFVRAARESKKAAFEGVIIAQRRDAQIEVKLSDSDMLATMYVTGPYGGDSYSGVEIMKALADAHVTKGINKLALKKVLSMSNSLTRGEKFEQAVAQGLQPVNGKDAQFVPQVEDINTRVLTPQESDNKTHKVDMRDLGETITVRKGEGLLRRVPATKGKPGYTVLGATIPPKPGNDALLKEGKGSKIDGKDPNLLVADQDGMPLIKKNTVDVDPAMVLKNVDVTTGHIKFKGSLIVTGDIEPGMLVRTTGSITVGGFIQSADVQAQEDIIVGKGIIGHAVTEEEEKACIVKTNGSIKSKYAQFSFLQAMGDIDLELHCMNNTIMCAGNLTVKDESGKHGTLSGGMAKAGGKIDAFHLGVEGDTATFVQAFARFNKYKQGIQELRERYRAAQDKTMEIIRLEMEFRKKPKEERQDEELASIHEQKAKNTALLEQKKDKLENAEAELERLLKENTITADKVYTRVTVQYGDERILNKKDRGKSTFFFDQYKIHCSTMVDGVESSEDL